MGRTSQQKDTSNKHLKTTRKISYSKKINTSQPKVNEHQVDMINSQLIPHVHTIEHAGGSEDPDSLILGNHDEFHGVQKISSIILVP
jgi:tRNA U54 and U55 pseudouridine synthase Pus10